MKRNVGLTGGARKAMVTLTVMVTAMAAAAAVAATATVAAAGCGPKKAATPAKPEGAAGDDYDPLARHDDGADDGLGIAGTFEGDLSPDEVQEVMRGAALKVNDCFAAGKTRNRFEYGAVSLRIIVARDGAVRESVVEDSSLGDRETERCLTGLAGALRFPKPRGGEVQMVLPLSFMPAGARGGVVERDASLAEAAAVRTAVEKACAAPGGTGYALTVYVGADGKALAAGFASSDVVDGVFADCAVIAATAPEVVWPKASGPAEKVRLTLN
jgi:hypothetical protein